MTDIVLGVLALLIGLLLCFRGRSAMRMLLAVWGAFVGFGLGATVVASLTGQGFLTTVSGWVMAILLALVFAALAYAFFALAVILAFASMGFVLGQTLSAALGLSEPWAITAVGVAGGLVLALLAILTNLPDLVLIIVSAVVGASVAVSGLMLLVDVIDVESFAESRVPLVDQPAWYLGQLVLAVIGIVVQLRGSRRQRMGSVRRSWAAPAR